MCQFASVQNGWIAFVYITVANQDSLAKFIDIEHFTKLIKNVF